MLGIWVCMWKLTREDYASEPAITGDSGERLSEEAVAESQTSESDDDGSAVLTLVKLIGCLRSLPGSLGLSSASRSASIQRYWIISVARGSYAQGEVRKGRPAASWLTA